MSELSFDKSTCEALGYPELKRILAGYTSTSLGRQKVEGMHPLLDEGSIRVCLEQTTEVCHLLRRGDIFSFTGVVDFSGSLVRAREQGLVLGPGELLDILHTLRQARYIRSFLLSLPEEGYAHLRRFAHHIRDLGELEEAIDSCITAQEEVREDASGRLRRICEEIREVEGRMAEIFDRLLSSSLLRGALQNSRPTLRGDRLCLAVKSSHRRRVRGILLDSSHTGQTLFIEPEEVTVWGNRLAELRYNRRQEINRILRRLTNLVLDSEGDLRHTLGALGWLDFTVAKARFSERFGMSSPVVGEGEVLRLFGARHPLLLSLFAGRGLEGEELLERVVSLELELGGDFRLLVITGPNAGGKTVALKTIGLLVLMALSGMHIPAREGSVVPLYRSVLACIGDQQSLVNALSTFSAGMVRMGEILAQAGEGVLVLMDEFGAGTDPREACALAEAILEELSSRGCQVVITTHLTELKKFAYRDMRARNACMEFDLERLEPTFRLMVGFAGNSKALEIARRFGLPEGVVSRARELMAGGEEEGWLDRLQAEVVEAQRSREEAVRELEASRRLRLRVEEELRSLERRREVMEREVELELERVRQKLLTQLPSYLRPFQNLSKSYRRELERLEFFLTNLFLGTSLEEKRRRFAQSLKKGGEVFVIPLGRKGVIRKINKSQGRLKILVGKVEFETSFEEVSWIGEVEFLEERFG